MVVPIKRRVERDGRAFLQGIPDPKSGRGTCWPRPGQKHAGRAAGHRWSRGKLSDHFSSMYFLLCSKYQTNQRLEHSCFQGFFFKYEEKIRQGYVLLTLDLSVSLLAKAGQNETSMPLKPRVYCQTLFQSILFPLSAFHPSLSSS